MRDSCILRAQFLDRAFDPDELFDLVDMVRVWHARVTGPRAGASQMKISARAYGFARPLGQSIRESLAAKLPRVEFESPNPDELEMTAAPTGTVDAPDLSLWREVLAEPLLQHTCVRLRFTLQGPMPGFRHGLADGVSTFVLCGTPANGALVVKAIWRVGSDQSIQLVYDYAAWDKESAFLEALEAYLTRKRTISKESAAEVAYFTYGGESKSLFVSRVEERKVMRVLRHRFELPDARGPAAFARRFRLPLLAGLCFLGLAWYGREIYWIAIICLLSAVYFLLSAARIIGDKMWFVFKYYRAMRGGLGKLYSGSFAATQIDLSDDKTPTLLKYSAELESLGAKHICDKMHTTEQGTSNGDRFYALGDVAINFGLLRKTEKLLFFPPMPILILATRFADGRRHATLNKPIYRKRSRATHTARCFLGDGGLNEMMALHRRHIDRMIAAGAVPISAPTTLADALQLQHVEFEDGRAAWNTSPYSWGDALHDAFKVCRREYLAD